MDRLAEDHIDDEFLVQSLLHSKELRMRRCRRNTSGSLPRGMPTVVYESVEVHVREPDGDTERKRQRLDRFRPPTWRNTLRPVSFGGLYCV